ncbi:MAG: hypothetical protein HKM93_17190 [Desulfobacteraceae bacterium]|nr:hypothetical protein [Desulfobacteraceae bacterium]
MTTCAEDNIQKNPGYTENRDFTFAFRSLSLIQTGPVPCGVDDSCGSRGAKFNLDWDISPLFPYINAVVEGAQYYEKPDYIRFLLSDRLCAFHPRHGAFTPAWDIGEAIEYLNRLSTFIIGIQKRVHDITPDHRKYKPASPVDIFRLLPATNCGECGYTTCLAFAAALARNRTLTVECPHLDPPVEEKATFPIYDRDGNCIRTVSLDIDTRRLRQKISRKESLIKSLESRLSAAERKGTANFHAANIRLPAPLTQRESQVLKMMADGLTNKDISGVLHISEHTVKSHVTHIFNKLGVNDRTQASVWAATHGIYN